MVVPNLGERKRTMMELADAYVALPGGPGTLDEVSDVISLARLKVDHLQFTLIHDLALQIPIQIVLYSIRLDFHQ